MNVTAIRKRVPCGRKRGVVYTSLLNCFHVCQDKLVAAGFATCLGPGSAAVCAASGSQDFNALSLEALGSRNVCPAVVRFSQAHDAGDWSRTIGRELDGPQLKSDRAPNLRWSHVC